MPAHDHVDLDAGQAAIVIVIPHDGGRHELGRRPETRRVVVYTQVVVDRLGHMKRPQVVPLGGGQLVHDPGGVGRVVTTDVKEGADVMLFKAGKDPLTVGLVGFVAG